MSPSSKYNQNQIVSKRLVGILGVGAIGAVIAKELSFNKNLKLNYFNRSKKKEIQVQHFEDFYKINTSNSFDISNKNQLDWLIICLKEYHFEGAKNWFEKLIVPKTKIVVIRNGLELKTPLLHYAFEDRILECMIDCPVQIDQNGIYQQIKNVQLASVSGELATEFQHLFLNKNFSLQQFKDFKTVSWKKLIESASLGAITCLTGETCWIFEKKEIKDWYQKIIEESILVAQADNAIIPNDFVIQLLEKVKTYPKNKGSSMLTDRLKGRPIELGAKNGVISKMGEKYKIPTPLNNWVCLMLKYTNREM